MYLCIISWLQHVLKKKQPPAILWPISDKFNLLEQIRILFYFRLCFICDWICKSCPKLHKKWNPIYSWTLKLNSSTIQAHQAHSYKWPNLLLQMAFVDHNKPWKCTAGLVKPVNGIIKDVSGAKLLPTTISAYPAGLVCFYHLLLRHSTTACVLMEGITHLWLPSSQYPPPPTCPPLICDTCDITVAVKRLLKILCVSQLAGIDIKH